MVEFVLRHPQAAAFHSVLRSDPSLQSIKASSLHQAQSSAKSDMRVHLECCISTSCMSHSMCWFPGEVAARLKAGLGHGPVQVHG